MNEQILAKDLIDFIYKSPSQFHVIKNIKDILDSNDFKSLSKKEKWEIKSGEKYYVENGNSAIIAFETGSDVNNNYFKIIGSHSDSPTLRIKPNPIIEDKGYIKLNTEVYGGPILSTWFDRPLSLAGRVIIKLEDNLDVDVRLIDIDKDLLIIPNLAIHMNRKINDGYKYDKQKDLIPIMGLIKDELEKEDYLINIIEKELKISKENILDFELYLYDRSKGSTIGMNEEFISVGKIDNLGMVYPSLRALIDSKNIKGTKMIFIADNEEVGSQTPQGAGSPFLKDTLKRINYSLGGNLEDYYRSLAKSFVASADQSHGYHPNYSEKNDITNFPILNMGPTIKVSSNKSYATDALSSGKFINLCTNKGIPYQYFVNNSKVRGGSTIGPIISENLDIEIIDVGIPVLSMHSIRELAGVNDLSYIYECFLELFNKN